MLTCADDILLLEKISVRIVDNLHRVLHLLPYREGEALVTVEGICNTFVCGLLEFTITNTLKDKQIWHFYVFLKFLYLFPVKFKCSVKPKWSISGLCFPGV